MIEVIMVILWEYGGEWGRIEGWDLASKAPTGLGDRQPPRGGMAQQAEFTPGEKSPGDSCHSGNSWY